MSFMNPMRPTPSLQVRAIPMAVAAVVAALCASQANAGLVNDVPSEFTTIQAAVNAASDGDEIVLAPGTHSGVQNRDIDLGGKAITIRSTNPSDPAVVASTVIDCTQQGRAFILQSGETPATVFDGLTIRNGFALSGAAIYIADGSGATIRRCILTGHTAPTANAAIRVENTPLEPGDLVIERCLIEDNLGGGLSSFFLSSLTMTDTTVRDNTGSGVSTTAYGTTTVDVRDSVFVGNGGMGLHLIGSLVEVSGCTMTDNDAAGLSVNGVFGGAHVEVANCTIARNSATSGAAGLICTSDTTAVVRNCMVVDNGGQSAGGMVMSGFGSFEIRSSTFSGNTAALGGGGIRAFGARPVTIENCILWGNVAPVGPQLMLDSGFNDASVVTIDYSDLQGGAADVVVEQKSGANSQLFVGANVLDVDPLFADAENGDFRLSSASALIGAGDPAFVADPGESDLDGDPRVVGRVVDIGADEFRAPSDIDGDGVVGFSDLTTVLLEWGACEVCESCPADIDGDCGVGFADLTMLLISWG